MLVKHGFLHCRGLSCRLAGSALGSKLCPLNADADLFWAHRCRSAATCSCHRRRHGADTRGAQPCGCRRRRSRRLLQSKLLHCPFAHYLPQVQRGIGAAGAGGRRLPAARGGGQRGCAHLRAANNGGGQVARLPCERQRLCQRCPNLGLLVASAQSATACNVIPHPAILHTCLHIPSHCPIRSTDHAGLHHPCLLADLCWLVMAHVTDRRRQGVYIFRDERIGTGFGSYLCAWGRNHAINETVGMGTWGGACVAPRGRSKCGRVEKAPAQRSQWGWMSG